MLVGVLSGLPGCMLFAPPARELTGSGMDMFAPQEMRIHPLSQVLAGETPAGTPAVAKITGAESSATGPAATMERERPEQVEVHVEFKDQFGDVGKAVGIMKVLVQTPGFGLLRGDTVAQWSVDLQTPQANGQYWDSITRTYVFRYRVPDAATLAIFKSGARFVIRATMEFTNHTTLQDELPVTIK